MIHVCYGTQAELIKLAPVLLELGRRAVRHRTIETGQHPQQTESLRATFGLRPADCVLWRGPAVTSLPGAGRWAATLLARCVLGRASIRGPDREPGGVMVVHGDTLTTLVGAMMARLIGLKLAHVESGLRSFRWLSPFPEELVRVAVNRRADVLFPPGEWAAENLRRMRVRGRIVTLPANTGKDAREWVLRSAPAERARPRPYGLVSIHRFETVMSATRIRRSVEVVVKAAGRAKIVWPIHAVTRQALVRRQLLGDLERAGVELADVQPYPQFQVLLRDAEFVIADGGSIQEESWFADKPCLLLRSATERGEGLGENVVLSRWDAGVIDDFLAAPARFRRTSPVPSASPSAMVVDELLRMK